MIIIQSCYNYLQVKIVFRRKWFYHLITIFIQSILLLAVAYMTFYFRINNFQVVSFTPSSQIWLIMFQRLE